MIFKKLTKLLSIKVEVKNRQALVHWLNWPKKFDSWVLPSAIEDYNL